MALNLSVKAKGFTLIEVLVGLTILSIALLALAGLMVTATKNNAAGCYITEAATFAQDKLEELRVASWGSVVSGSDVRQGSTGINYTRNWNVVANPLNNQRWVDITVRWTDRTSHSINLLSVVSQ
jgi:prepilin-type N-terminal cleavage/methylation domain-containing protein